jgi:hypothetical protein
MRQRKNALIGAGLFLIVGAVVGLCCCFYDKDHTLGRPGDLVILLASWGFFFMIGVAHRPKG